ncbi:hypothetical protein TL16_g06355 [Triparma laevis f. inornata]|uniref:J domain-containing protein n=1 Tax=Triparma laevis f. inornata TaxID=1714386 RepID=A0A9W7AS09_9STRA|nr:hypothetical protein TL16_g06355 [Triparma laevis f. inornata]
MTIIYTFNIIPQDFYDAKCSACVSVVAELERNLELEPPRQNVDLRNTLQAPTGKDGKKKKVIAYEVSELRGVEVIEELCKGMDQYGIVRQEDGMVSFQRYNAKGAGTVRIMGSMTLGSDQFQEDRKRLQSYCDALVEEHEETLLEAIRAAGLAKLAMKQEELKVAKAKREGRSIVDDTEIDEMTRAYFTLGLDPIATPHEVKNSYRQLTKKLHPDKVGEDGEKLKQFHEVAKAYEKITGEALTPYGDLYREVCITITEECELEEEVEHIRQFFPRYKGSKIKGMAEDFHDIQGRLGNHNTGNDLERKRKERVRKNLEKEVEKERLEELEKRKERKKKKKKRKNKKASTAIRDNDEL